MTEPASYGAKLRQFREDAGLTQEQLAAAIGATWMTIHRYETDQRLPRWDDVLRIATELGKTPNDFMPLDPPDDPRPRGKLQ